MGQIGARELVLLAVIVLLIFGAKRLPDIARSLGKSARILKSETAAMKAENASAAPQPAQDAEAQTPPVAKTIKAAPGDVTTARPVEEPRPAAG
ncbi:Sec-independent protein translocase subunit TatA [Streptomyces marincola]|uniref:Sec-independent protein translocase subunit TatA n=1 Tax=Streptomyces marincola TaxID=2878388 RepID=UPI001CF3278F|nr:Sec-independent protein translocase subunit TatA [Streptomyces marincola]UCM89173.1 Sec-independent protein translocase subunit TatA [Streptomyces marincola]